MTEQTDNQESQPDQELKPQRELALDYTRSKTPAWVREVIEAHLAIEAEDAKSAGALGFMTRALVVATMPYKDPKTDVFSRKNGDISLRIIAGYEGGIPYGIYPRLLLAWITTEAVRTKSRKIELGDSLSYFLREVLEINRGGGPRGSSTRVAEQMKRLFGSMVNVTSASESTGRRFRLKNVTIADDVDFDEQHFTLDDPKIHVGPGLVGADGRPLQPESKLPAGEQESLLWTPQESDTAGAWKSHVNLNQNFYDECIDRPVPIDLRAYRALRRAPLAMDIYTWLTYRMSYIHSRSRPIPWEALMGQFGSNYAGPRGVLDFKKGFLKALRFVQITYPNARVEVTDKGLVLLPSPTHIPKQTFSQGELTFGGQ
ncbi:replication protein RepA [Pseudomonas syringae pv. coryli]|uniref:replication protein RepA n=1 Tax=Pseudomonas syringae pv. coryli TaxID=317659 RepID=UPI003D2A8FBA